MDPRTIEWYNVHADRYAAETIDFASFPGLEKDVARFAELFSPDARLVDLGSGGGRDSRYFARCGLRVTAVDASPQLLAILSEVCRGMSVAPILADLEALPFANESFQGIWACGTLLHLEEKVIAKVLGSCFSILTPGGWLGLSMKEGSGTYRKETRRFTLVSKAFISAELTSAGFNIVSISGPDRNDWLLMIAQKPG